MMDDSGNIIWYPIADSTLSRPFNKGNNFSYLSQSEKTLFHEISFNGDTLFSKNTDSEILHHDILRNDSMFVALTYEYIDFNSNEFDSLMGDGIVIYDLKGNKIWKWNIFDHVDPNGIKTVLDQISQYQLIHNYLVILTDNELTKYSLLEYERALSIRTSILVFEELEKEDFNIYEISGTATLHHKMTKLGQLFQVNLKSVISKTRKNRNLNGITITATYNHLPPFCIVHEDQVNGTFFDLINTIGNVLNFTVKLQKPSKGNESWGKM